MKSLVKKESVEVLKECIELQNRKSQDYQSKESNVTQAMHYCSFAVSYMRGKMEGQSSDRDMFNKQIDHPLRKIKL